MPRSVGRHLFYGWIVVAITYVTVLITSGIRSAPQVFIHPLEDEFGWNRAAIASAVSINLLLYGAAAPISGRLVDRFGPRRMMLASLALLGTGVAGTVAMSALWQLQLIWGVAVGLGAGATASVLSATVVTRWFVARRGVVLGIMGSAHSTGQLIFLPLLMSVVVGFGWRAGSLMLAAVALALVVPVLLWMRDDPADVGVTAYGAESMPSAAGGPQADPPATPLRQAVRTSEFWLLMGAFFTCGATANGLIGTHLIPHSIDHGIPAVAAAGAVGVMGGMNFVGSFISGWLCDRVDPRKVLAFVFAFRGLSLLLLPSLSTPSGLLVFAVIYGLDWVASAPAVVTLTANRFGKRSIGTIYGWIFLSHQVGGATSASLAGAVRVWSGDYQYAFMAGGVVALLGASMALFIRTRRPVAAPTLAPVARA